MSRLFPLLFLLAILGPVDARAQECGDGRLDNDRDGVLEAGEEECDDGDQDDEDACDNRCRFNLEAQVCGDGVVFGDSDHHVEAGEEACDDGNRNNDDYCLNNCRVNVCGDGFLGPGEVCDDGPANSEVLPDACRADCRPAYCSDGVVDERSCRGDFSNCVYVPEECDDGGRNSDFEPNTCREGCLLPTCGDGVVDNLYGEECDEGPDNSDLPDATCSRGCIIPGCGNGVLETWEQCDDGNMSDNDGCTSQCRYNVCGDGLLSSDDDVELCEYAQPWDRGECRYDCGQSLARCGNRRVDPGEGCDDGADRNSDEPDNPCRRDCQPRRCGDGVVDMGEACDRTPGCAPDCSLIGPR